MDFDSEFLEKEIASISVISWWLVLLVEETRENLEPVASQ